MASQSTTNGGYPGKWLRLSLRDLKGRLRERLHGHDAFGPPISRQTDETPERWLIELYRGADDQRFRSRFATALGQLLRECATQRDWEDDAVANLLFLVQDAAPERALRDVQKQVEQELLLSRGERGRELHALLLACLPALGDWPDPDFWLDQLGKVGLEFGPMIFVRLVHGYGQDAFDYLPRLIATEEAVDNLVLAAPEMASVLGEGAMKREFAAALPRLSSRLRAGLRTGLEDMGYGLPEARTGSWPNRWAGGVGTGADVERVFPVYRGPPEQVHAPRARAVV